MYSLNELSVSVYQAVKIERMGKVNRPALKQVHNVVCVAVNYVSVTAITMMN